MWRKSYQNLPSSVVPKSSVSDLLPSWSRSSSARSLIYIWLLRNARKYLSSCRMSATCKNIVKINLLTTSSPICVFGSAKSGINLETLFRWLIWTTFLQIFSYQDLSFWGNLWRLFWMLTLPHCWGVSWNGARVHATSVILLGTRFTNANSCFVLGPQEPYREIFWNIL
jgi:hypothetical protein